VLSNAGVELSVGDYEVDLSGSDTVTAVVPTDYRRKLLSYGSPGEKPHLHLIVKLERLL